MRSMNKSTKSLIKHIPDYLDYLEIEKGLSNKTQENYSRFLNRFTEWLQNNKHENVLPHQLTSDVVWKYRVYLSRETESKKSDVPLKKSTQNYYLIALRGLLSFFADRDIQSLPADKIKLAKSKAEHNIHFLTVEQVFRLLESPNIQTKIGLRDRAILETLFSTGLRVAELVKLDREQFKLKDSTEMFELTVIGKGSKPRIIYFSERCIKSLKKYLDDREDMDPALFINYRNQSKSSDSRRLTVRSVENIVKKYVKMAGLPLNTTPHTLRHSFATDLLTQGVDLRLVQEFLGHQSISTTQIYTHVTNKKLRDVYKKFHSKKSKKNVE